MQLNREEKSEEEFVLVKWSVTHFLLTEFLSYYTIV